MNSNVSRTQPVPFTAAVIGGGLAGLAAAVRLAEQGLVVTLVETRKRLGGRATSFSDPATGESLDNCQHVVMGCCTALLDLYRRLGVHDRIAWHDTLYFADCSGRIDTVTADDLPAPFHLARATFRMKMLSWRDKLAISRGMLAILQLSDQGRRATAELTFAEWLREYDQPQSAIDRFWAPVAISACNELPTRVAAPHALQVFQQGFLAHEDAYRVGLATVPLVELYDPTEQHLRRTGGRILTGTSADGLDGDGRRIFSLRVAGSPRIEADVFVAAVPFDRLAKLVTETMVAADTRLQDLDGFGVTPIIGVHLFLRRPDGGPLTALPYVALVESPLQWVFNKGVRREAAADTGIHHLHGVISAAHDWVDRPADQIITMALTELRRHLPSTEQAELVHARVVKEKRATFSATPDAERIRPPAMGAIENLFLAGDWTDTGWPATMEGAVRSGYVAAEAALDRLRLPHEPLAVPDLEPGPLYRFVSG